jgi:hypothetical protein
MTKQLVLVLCEICDSEDDNGVRVSGARIRENIIIGLSFVHKTG